ncbi:MAG: hypothetical protein QOE26_1359 [Verrucomicrobiota bacterium]
MKAFVATLILLALACAWWVWAKFFSRQSTPPVSAPKENVYAANVSGNVAAAGRDVHQTIYQAPPFVTASPQAPQRAEFFYNPERSKITFRFGHVPAFDKTCAIVDLLLHFDNRGNGPAYNLAADIHGCWIHDEPPRAVRIDRIEPTLDKILQGDGRSLNFAFSRPAGTSQPDGTGFLTLNTRKDILVVLIEITFTQTAGSEDVCKNDPIWLTWTPQRHTDIVSTTHSDVAIARPAIDRIRQGGIDRTEREPQSVFVALDELKEMEHEGQKMLDRMFLHGDFPTLPELGDFLSRTLAAARQKVFAPRVTAKEIGKFQKEWDETELLQQKAMLYDAGFLKDDSPDSNKLGTVDLLYSRVQRLKELIAFIEDDSATPPAS